MSSFPCDPLCVSSCHAAVSCLLEVANVSIQVQVKNLTCEEIKTQFYSMQEQIKTAVIEERVWLSEMIKSDTW